jgi:MFS family permease
MLLAARLFRTLQSSILKPMLVPSLPINPWRQVWLLGLTQIVGYGTLYYSVAILAESIAGDFDWPVSWVYASFSVGLVGGGLISPIAGRQIDKWGSARLMTWGSVAAAFALALAAVTPNGFWFAVCLILMQMAGTLVLYDAAFVALTQKSGGEAPLRIVQLTLIAGFASTLFWPLTGWLNEWLGWRLTLLLFAAANLFAAAPIHLILSRAQSAQQVEGEKPLFSRAHELVPAALQRRALVLVTLGFMASGFALSAVLAQLVPALKTLGLGDAALAVSMVFGPAQIFIRFGNLIFGSKHHPLAVTVVAMALLPLAMLLLLVTAPGLAGAVLFAMFLGFYSGLTSIVSGTLPLALFGTQNFGARLGRIALFRKVLAAVAPFVLAWSIEMLGAALSLLCLAILSAFGTLAFVEVSRISGIRLR